MKNYQKKYTSLILFGVFFNIFSIHSQTSTSNNSLYNWFDKAFEKENLPIYNGTRHINYYRTLDNTHSYYVSANYSSGDVEYEDQTYYNLDLKYDINNDILVFKPKGKFDYLGINIIKEKTASFTIQNKHFVNINYNGASCPDYMSGYYQEIVYSKNNILYIKHHKNRSKVIDTKSVSDDVQNSTDTFTEKNEFVLKYKDTYYKIASKSDVIKIFPELKSKIKNYYSTNKQLEEVDNKVFVENLIKEINNFLPNESK
ncbi:hypothetical protein [Flavobacterium daemonense]|uniref:hypothetical protein n=1 Tax=Flavobacterium daemonense TaxID=1393049 RepID=UPI001184FFDE|nr:hypothetical protein [Flavobacterium daemonense]KAF2334417.1 hypothetical protein FND99_08940 [Flavobacterium daemonense]